mgnify:FL=1
MKHLTLPLSLMVALGYLAIRADQNKQIAVAAFNYAEKTRPSVNAMCGKYFEWSAMMKDRVSSMEEQCGVTP